MVEQILVPMDDSPQATAAFEYALAEFPEASITVIHVIELPEGYWMAFVKSEDDFPGYEQAHDRANDLLEETVERASDADRDIETVVETGKPAHEIVEYAVENDVDQIVIGSHGRKRAGRLLFGSVSESVVRTAPMTVVVVHDA